MRCPQSSAYTYQEGDDKLSGAALELLQDLQKEFDDYDKRIDHYDQKLQQISASNEACRQL